MTPFVRITTALSLVLMVACGGNSGTAPRPAELSGSWTATKVEFRATGSSIVVDAITMGGAMTLTLVSDHTFHLAITWPPGTPPCLTCGNTSFDGTWQASSDELTLTPSGLAPGSQWQFDLNLAGDNLTLTGANTEYDFNSDGAPEPAKWNLCLKRQ